MANKRMNRCSPPHVVRERQVEPTWHSTPVSMASPGLVEPQAGADVQQQDLSLPLVGKQNGAATLVRRLGNFLQNNILHAPAVTDLGVHPWVENFGPHTHTKKSSFIAQTWMQPRCPSVGDWIKITVVDPDNGILLFTVKKKCAVKTWKDLKEANVKDYMWYDSKLWHSGKARPWRQQKMSAGQGLDRR